MDDLGTEVLGDAGHMLVVTASVPGVAAAAAAAAAEGLEAGARLHVGDVVVGLSGSVLSRSAAEGLRLVSAQEQGVCAAARSTEHALPRLQPDAPRAATPRTNCAPHAATPCAPTVRTICV